jgi:hypothetical protein
MTTALRWPGDALISCAIARAIPWQSPTWESKEQFRICQNMTRLSGEETDAFSTIWNADAHACCHSQTKPNLSNSKIKNSLRETPEVKAEGNNKEAGRDYPREVGTRLRVRTKFHHCQLTAWVVAPASIAWLVQHMPCCYGKKIPLRWIVLEPQQEVSLTHLIMRRSRRRQFYLFCFHFHFHHIISARFCSCVPVLALPILSGMFYC